MFRWIQNLEESIKETMNYLGPCLDMVQIMQSSSESAGQSTWMKVCWRSSYINKNPYSYENLNACFS